jgi:hypothetical protein
MLAVAVPEPPSYNQEQKSAAESAQMVPRRRFEAIPNETRKFSSIFFQIFSF